MFALCSCLHGPALERLHLPLQAEAQYHFTEQLPALLTRPAPAQSFSLFLNWILQESLTRGVLWYFSFVTSWFPVA